MPQEQLEAYHLQRPIRAGPHVRWCLGPVTRPGSLWGEGGEQRGQVGPPRIRSCKAPHLSRGSIRTRSYLDLPQGVAHSVVRLGITGLGSVLWACQGYLLVTGFEWVKEIKVHGKEGMERWKQRGKSKALAPPTCPKDSARLTAGESISL
ncbi:hypothetical protein F5888DRAFT_1726117 [Russula emetica]|nr:hypothetical protein F5888DRAFT_1726117 [Russula emetica]